MASLSRVGQASVALTIFKVSIPIMSVDFCPNSTLLMNGAAVMQATSSFAYVETYSRRSPLIRAAVALERRGQSLVHSHDSGIPPTFSFERTCYCFMTGFPR